MLRWAEGPRKLGCVYHKRGICALDQDSLVVDIFIMPSLVRRRPIAITLGRYRNYRAIERVQWALQSPDDLSPVSRNVPAILANMGVRAEEITMLTHDIEQLLLQEQGTLRDVLESVESS
jgi:hypothetical protein